jgi:transketolase
MATPAQIENLRKIATGIRINILKMLNTSGSGHTGGSLSAVEILTSLFFSEMKYRAHDPGWEGRDHFVLSKGHAAPVLYATLAQAEFFAAEELSRLRRLGCSLQGHPSCVCTPGVEVSTGSLGQGLSMALGLALAVRLDQKPSRVYALCGDGEMQEGQIWEAAMAAAHFRVDNLCMIVDNNGLQIDGPVAKVMGIEPLWKKWEDFGWGVQRIDGHNLEEILDALATARQIRGRPAVIIAKTVKGKGVSFFENKVEYHGVAPSADELKRALKELEG